MPTVLKGAPVAKAIEDELKEKIKALDVTPYLAIVRVGKDAGAMSYERSVIKFCDKVGIGAMLFVFPEDCSTEELISLMDAINMDDTVHGCLLFRPLPESIDEEAVCERLDPAKDVDGMTSGSFGKLMTGRGAGYTPCTAQSVIEILDYYNINVASENVVVLGRSLVIGKPVSMLLQNKDATVTMCHSKTQYIEDICGTADVLISAVGKRSFVTADCVRPDQVIIDVGINPCETGICGDVEYEDVKDIVAAITPVPGGVGSVTTAVLCKHVVEAALEAR